MGDAGGVYGRGHMVNGSPTGNHPMPELPNRMNVLPPPTSSALYDSRYVFHPGPEYSQPPGQPGMGPMAHEVPYMHGPPPPHYPPFMDGQQPYYAQPPFQQYPPPFAGAPPGRQGPDLPPPKTADGSTSTKKGKSTPRRGQSASAPVTPMQSSFADGSGSPVAPIVPAPKSTRGRKQNDNLPPSRARDVQRAFRARRAARLAWLEARVVELERENAELRARLEVEMQEQGDEGMSPPGSGESHGHSGESYTQGHEPTTMAAYPYSAYQEQ